MNKAGAAIVVGASSGIGAATAVALAEEGYRVGITYRDNEKGARDTYDAVTTAGGDGAFERLDLVKGPHTAKDVFDALTVQLGAELRIVVNCAAVNRRCPALDEDEAGWEETLSANLVGAWATSRAAAVRMTKTGGGRIVHVGSILGSMPVIDGAAYCASKAGLEALCEVLALEWARYGITVNVVAPGHVATPMNYATARERSEAAESRPVIPLGRAARADEIARAIVTLPDYMTGSVVHLDGGLALRSGPEALRRAIGGTQPEGG